MKQQKLLIPTLREVPSDAEVTSHKLMMRAGLIRQLVSGVYTYLPLGFKVLKKVEAIVREEMNRSEAQEILTSAIQPAELWQESGRWDAYGPELMRFKDRHDRDFVLGPTHEEVFTSLMRDEINSYKKLPVTIYQIQTKYRDERRPRFGVIRAREFIMKDAYSFDVDTAGLDESYQAMYDAYHRTFKRCGLNYRAIEADGGAIGGEGGTHEFMALSEIGEDTIVHCPTCGFAANIEKAENIKVPKQQQNLEELTLIETPNQKSIKELASFLQVEEKTIIKTLLYKADEQQIVVLIAGDDEVNDIKLKNLLDATNVSMLQDDEIEALLGQKPGFLGPKGLPANLRIIADYKVEAMNNAVIGANKKDYHYKNANPGRDFNVEQFADLRNIQLGDPCPKCNTPVLFDRGIEVGHVFKLGTKYSKALRAKFLDENGKEQLMVMGCYGIGVSRTVAAIVEQHSDENGIIWPKEVAPFHVHVIPINVKNEKQYEVALNIYNDLLAKGVEVLFDDRLDRAGSKFKDADLIGIPLRIVVGGKVDEGFVELKYRKTGESRDLEITQVTSVLLEELNQLDL
ncbi:proline--tRNA ligase [Desulfuribacillus stibiiarsenatis]|uniref:Proline--tRNA ligase n=1 Tax=Desulfuribacillus stibiiarsenatis TaxID=1390249 RepID=A0A1E5L7A5_9FIRM|nr:proline--tRNA ligase [Desulfuribacillus stibiiarsenatis]OEH85853.1 proline--tRNA ligase [Desulfuribacillus stibiiarsenatis]